METDNDLAVGDMVAAFTNDFIRGWVLAPKEVFSFQKAFGMAVDAYISVIYCGLRPSRTTHHTQQRRTGMTNEDKILKRFCGQYCLECINWRKILHTATLLPVGEICVPLCIWVLRTDGLHRSFPLYQYTGSGIRLGNGQTGPLTARSGKVICGTNNKYQYGTEFLYQMAERYPCRCRRLCFKRVSQFPDSIGT